MIGNTVFDFFAEYYHMFLYSPLLCMCYCQAGDCDYIYEDEDIIALKSVHVKTKNVPVTSSLLVCAWTDLELLNSGLLTS